MWILLVNVQIDVPWIEPSNKQPKRALINSIPYTLADLGNLLQGQPPYDSVLRYSDELRSLVRNCLHYDPAARSELNQLQSTIAQAIRAPPANHAPGPLRLLLADDHGDFREGRPWDGREPLENYDPISISP
jgi:hypothetical protein